MIHTNLKKRYTPPQIEVTISEIEDELLTWSFEPTGEGPSQEFEGEELGNGSKANFFGYDNFAEYYDDDDYDDYYEF